MVFGFQIASPARASTTSLAVADFNSQTTFITVHSASEIRGGLFLFFWTLVLKLMTSYTCGTRVSYNCRNSRKKIERPKPRFYIVNFSSDEPIAGLFERTPRPRSLEQRPPARFSRDATVPSYGRRS